MKTWKIVLLIISVLVVAFIGFVIYNGYQYSKFYDNAESMGAITFGSELFDKKLMTCQLAYADTWEIRGLENNNCIVIYSDSKVDYETGIITHKSISCELPYSVYTSKEIDWNNPEYCN